MLAFVTVVINTIFYTIKGREGREKILSLVQSFKATISSSYLKHPSSAQRIRSNLDSSGKKQSKYLAQQRVSNLP